MLIHGRPLVGPWRLHRARTGNELLVVAPAAHDTRDSGMSESIVAAIDRLRRG